MGSRPSAPVTYRPTPTAATIYQSVIPEEDYKNLSSYVDELKAERQKKKSEREAQGIGGSAFKKRLDLYSQAEADTYKASLPKKPGFQKPKP
mgnify:CR=1 FL=1